MYLSLFTLCSNYFHQKNIQVFFFHIFKSHLSNVSKNYVTIQICEPFLPSQYILYVAVCKLLRCLTQFCLMVLSFVFIYMCVYTYIHAYIYIDIEYETLNFYIIFSHNNRENNSRTSTRWYVNIRLTNRSSSIDYNDLLKTGECLSELFGVLLLIF